MEYDAELLKTQKLSRSGSVSAACRWTHPPPGCRTLTLWHVWQSRLVAMRMQVDVGIVAVRGLEARESVASSSIDRR
nr:hypothetical protein OG546_00645 [Streptomyces antimycoticus]